MLPQLSLASSALQNFMAPYAAGVALLEHPDGKPMVKYVLRTVEDPSIEKWLRELVDVFDEFATKSMVIKFKRIAVYYDRLEERKNQLRHKGNLFDLKQLDNGEKLLDKYVTITMFHGFNSKKFDIHVGLHSIFFLHFFIQIQYSTNCRFSLVGASSEFSSKNMVTFASTPREIRCSASMLVPFDLLTSPVILPAAQAWTVFSNRS